MYINIYIYVPKIYTKLWSLKIGQLKFYTTGFLGYSMVQYVLSTPYPRIGNAMVDNQNHGFLQIFVSSGMWLL